MGQKGFNFLRWTMPKSEFYFEYGRNNDSWSWSQLTQEPQTNSAYIMGFSKLLALKKPNQYLEFNLELSTLQQPADYIIAINEPKSWYLHETVRHGYTNNGESLGHRAGPGGSMQLLEVNWINSLNKIGVRFERLVHNNDFYYLTHFGSNGGVFWKYWIDYSLSLEINKVYKKVLINLSIQGTKSINYQWQVDPDAPVFEQGTNQDELNFNAFVNLAYLF